MRDLSTLEERIGIKFKNLDLLRQSVVHRSYLNENPSFKLHHNERLEFLGDAVLEIIVTEHLYNNYPETPEGDLTNWRASLVNARMLAIVAGEIELEDFKQVLEFVSIFKGFKKSLIAEFDKSELDSESIRFKRKKS